MKKVVLITIAIVLSISAYTQEDDEFNTVIKNFEITKIRGFGGPSMSFSTIDGQFVHFMGGGGAVILNNKFFFGGFGTGTTNLVDAKEYLIGTPEENRYENFRVEMNYGGFWLGYIIGGSKPIHPIIHLQTGWGRASLSEDVRDNDDFPFRYSSSSTTRYSSSIFVLNPVVEVEMNITRFFRLGVGANYRLVYGLDLNGYANNDFAGPGGFLSFKFGWF